MSSLQETKYLLHLNLKVGIFLPNSKVVIHLIICYSSVSILNTQWCYVLLLYHHDSIIQCQYKLRRIKMTCHKCINLSFHPHLLHGMDYVGSLLNLQFSCFKSKIEFELKINCKEIEYLFIKFKIVYYFTDL